MVWRTSASTAFRRWLISWLEISGCSIQLRSIRLPMAVLVLSSTHSRVPRFSRPRRVSVSSRFARVTGESRMNWASL